MADTLNPKQFVKEGNAAYKRGDYPAAAKAFAAAAAGYEAQGDALAAAEMMNNASVAYLQAEEPEAALQAVEGTAAVFAAAGDLPRQGMALGNYAAALEALDRFDEALESYEQSAQVLEQAGEDQLRLKVMQSISALQLRTGRQLQALASMQAGLESTKRLSPQQRVLKRLLDIPFKMLNKE